jgi:hypothetical protein
MRPQASQLTFDDIQALIDEKSYADSLAKHQLEITFCPSICYVIFSSLLGMLHHITSRGS